MACRSRDVVVCWIVQILFEFWSLLSQKLFRISFDLIFLFRCRSLETIKIGCQLWCFISMFNLQHNYHCMDYTINCIGIFTICSSLSIWPFLFVCIFVEIHCSDDILCECLVNEFWILKLQGIEWWMQIFWYGNDEWYAEGIWDPVDPMQKALYGHPDAGGHREKHCEAQLRTCGFVPVTNWPSMFWNQELISDNTQCPNIGGTEWLSRGEPTSKRVLFSVTRSGVRVASAQGGNHRTILDSRRWPSIGSMWDRRSEVKQTK